MQTTECLRQVCHAGSDSYRVDPAAFYLEIFYIYQVTFIATVTSCCVSEGVLWILTCTFWISIEHF